MRTCVTWLLLVVAAVGAGLSESAAQSRGPRPPVKLGTEAKKQVGEAIRKAADAAYGEEAAVCLERLRAALLEQLPVMDKFWNSPLSKGKTAQEEWQAQANALYEDLDLYGRSAVDAAKDARKEKKSRATDADLDRLKAQVDQTLKLADQVFRKKGLEVSTFRDQAQRAADTMFGFKTSMPLIIARLQADLAYASDCATGVHKDLQSGEEQTEVDLDSDVRGLEIAKRSVQAVKTVGVLRRALLAATMKAMSSETILAACQKAVDGWVPSDLTSGTLLTADQIASIQGWPALVTRNFGQGYAAVYEEGRKAVRPLADADFHKIGLFKNTSLGDLDKAMDPYINEAKAALQARRAFAASQKDAEQAEKLADEELAAAEKTRQAAQFLVGKFKDVEIKVLYEADRKRYQELAKRAAELTVEHESMTQQIKQKEASLKDLKKVRRTAKSSDQVRAHIMKIHGSQADLIKLKKQAEQVGSDLEEVWEEIDTMRKNVRAE